MRFIKSAIITGPTGAIGTALCRLLTEKGIQVFAVVRPGSVRAEHLKDIENVTILECDISQLAGLPAKMKDVTADVFFHLAWTKTVGEGRNDMDAQVRNIQYTLDACRVAKEIGAQVFVGAGSQAEYGRKKSALTSDMPCSPENGYGMAKLCAGQMSRVECAKFGIEHIWPRILSVYGPYDGRCTAIISTIEQLLKGEKPALTAGEQIWDYIYAGDAAEALYLLALYGKDGSIYPVGSGTAKPLKEYLEVLRDAIDPSLLLGFGEVPYGDKQVMHLEADISEARTDTGFEPQTDFETGIRKTIEYVRKSESK